MINLFRVLLDAGSELSFISEELVYQLKLSRKSVAIPLLGIGTYSGCTKGSVCATLFSEVNVLYLILAICRPLFFSVNFYDIVVKSG